MEALGDLDFYTAYFVAALTLDPEGGRLRQLRQANVCTSTRTSSTGFSVCRARVTSERQKRSYGPLRPPGMSAR